MGRACHRHWWPAAHKCLAERDAGVYCSLRWLSQCSPRSFPARAEVRANQQIEHTVGPGHTRMRGRPAMRATPRSLQALEGNGILHCPGFNDNVGYRYAGAGCAALEHDSEAAGHGTNTAQAHAPRSRKSNPRGRWARPPLEPYQLDLAVAVRRRGVALWPPARQPAVQAQEFDPCQVPQMLRELGSDCGGLAARTVRAMAGSDSAT